MLGLVGNNLNAHEDNKNFCTVNPKTNERINLQPWVVTGVVPATKSSPEKVLIYRPANEDDFKAILETQGEGHKAPLVGVLPDHIAKEKSAMFAKAMTEYNKLIEKKMANNQAPQPAESK
ncbi:MAG: hypothetical protein ABI851_12185 [Saprospiraceae bacterium]